MIKFNRIIKKFFYALLAISLVCVIGFFLIQKRIKALDPNRIALIDKIENNYIFRGNNPFVVKDGKMVFAYDELTSYFNNILSKQGLSPLQDYYLIDVSLLDIDHYYAIKSEKQFFAEHNNQGRVINISTLSPGLLFGQFANSNILTSSITNNYMLWINSTLKEVHDIASRQMDKPVVIYIHCNSGRDRTGLMAASYKLLSKNINLAEVRSQNVTEAGRNSVRSYDQAIGSYCLYVKQIYNKPNEYCISDPKLAF